MKTWTIEEINQTFALYSSSCIKERIEFYWNMIGDNYRVEIQPSIKDTKCRLIVLSNELYDKIKEDTTFGRYSGKEFIRKWLQARGRKYADKLFYIIYPEREYQREKENMERWCRKLQEKPSPKKEELNKDSSRGVYGIYQEGKLIYIGMTTRSFKERWNEHKVIIEGERNKPEGMILYDIIEKNQDKIEFRALIDVTKVKVSSRLTNRDIKAMELALITLYHPEGNYQGVRKDYEF